MTLLISFMCAITVTIIWYSSEKARKMKIGILCYMYWGSSIMWTVDAIAEYMEMGADYFMPSAKNMLNDTFLGLSVCVLGLIVWTGVLLVKDPQNVIKSINTNKGR